MIMNMKYLGIALTCVGLVAAVASAPAQQSPQRSGVNSFSRDSLGQPGTPDQPGTLFSADVFGNQGANLYSTSTAWSPEARSERTKLTGQESVLAHEADQLKHNLERAQSDAQRSEIRTKLAENLGKQFDLRQKRHGLEIEALETQVKKLKELVRKRQDAREEIISRRVEQTLREADGLGW
jgi:hypothetical protein